MHVIVGGSGFLGQHLAKALNEEGLDVVVCDKEEPRFQEAESIPFRQMDLTQPSTLQAIGAGPEDTVYHLAARLLVPIVPRKHRREFFFEVNYEGTANLLNYLKRQGCRRVMYFTTDMVYGHTLEVPRTETHPIRPLGPYGESKQKSEELCKDFRMEGFQICIFRPRLIIGPGRLGILSTLFRLIERGLPVPMIGNGKNHYQFISVHDCVQAAILATQKGVPNEEYNLGSKNPPPVRELLGGLIKEVGSRSILLPTPAPATKLALEVLDRIGIPLLDPEQYLIADETCILSTAKAETELGWVPKHSDGEMLRAAFQEYKNLGETITKR